MQVVVVVAAAAARLVVLPLVISWTEMEHLHCATTARHSNLQDKHFKDPACGTPVLSDP